MVYSCYRKETSARAKSMKNARGNSKAVVCVPCLFAHLAHICFHREMHDCLLSEKILDHNILTISNIANPLISTYEAISRTDSSQCTLGKLSFLLHQRQVNRA